MEFPNISQLHHANIITGNRAANLVLVKKYLDEQGIVTDGNPDLFIFETDGLGIDLVRDEIVRSVASGKVSSARFVILSFDRATAEAQNGLLKSIEEPQAGTYFFILVPRADVLLQTILSRSQTVDGNQAIGETRLDVVKFLKSNLPARFTMVEEWTKNKKDEDNLSKTEVINFLDQVEKYLWDAKNRNEQLFSDIRQMRTYANIRGASHRVILDFIAMIVPILK